MLRQYELVERVKDYDPDADEALLNRAYVYTVQKHGSQKRASGDPYFSHPVEVAGLMTDLKLDQDTVVTALLHDTVEDTLATIDDIKKNFGPDVARLVDGVTKLSKIEQMPENERAAENLRKFLLAMSEDLRVLLVKLADRLHNMRTLHFIKSAEKRRRIARETMDIYAPLAERVGMYEYMREMQLLAFEQIEPEAYATITGRLAQIRSQDGGQVDAIALAIKQALAEAGLRVEVSGREKHPYSIWRKMAERHVSFEQITDIMAFRVLTESVGDCYRALGVLHATWQFIPGRFKDYISTPKTNGYRSLHTSLIYENSMRMEVQVRTREMHRLNEFGLAAHWAYKQGGTRPDGQVGWLRDLIEIVDASHDADELLENTKLAIYQDRIFAFTPKGALHQLPKGATPVDFAFAVHTDLGAQAVHLLVKLDDAFLELGALPVAGLASQIEDPLLACYQLRDLRVLAGPGAQLGRKRDGADPVALGLEPRLSGSHLVEVGLDDAEIGPQHDIVEPQQKVAGLDPRALLDQKLADRTAGLMLDFLDLGFDDDLAGADHCSGDLRAIG